MKTQNQGPQSAQNSSNTTENRTETPELGVCNAANIINVLWQNAANSLSKERLLVGISGSAAYRLANPEQYDRKPKNVENASDKKGGEA